MKKTLLCTGGSEYSFDAIRFAAPIARGMQVRVTLLVVDDPHEKIDVKRALEKGLGILREFGIEAESRVRRGNPAREILEESAAYDLLVLGYMGTRGIADFLLGDTAMRIVEHSNISTLVVRGRRKLRKILACLSVSKYNPHVLDTIAEIARAIGCEAHLLNVVPVPQMYPIPTEAERTYEELTRCYPERAEFLEQCSKRLRSLGVESVHTKLREGFPEEEILKEASEGDFDLIVLGSHGWHGISDLLLGSLSFVVAKHARISVLVVKPKAGKLI